MQKENIEHLSKEMYHRQEELLAVLEAVTDPAITHLALDDLFRVVLDRICAITRADNLAVLLLNEERTTLYMRAVHGIEELVASSVRVPLGRGFAGQIAAQAAPLVCYDLSQIEIVTPLLREQLRALLGVPLLVNNQVIGVIHIGMKYEYRFTDHDITMLVRVADYLAHAIERARLVEVEQRAHIEAVERANELETIFETLTDGLIVYDQKGKILRSNSTARQILGIQENKENLSTLSLEERAKIYQPKDEYGRSLLSNDLPINRLLRGERLENKDTVSLRINMLDGREALLSITGAPYYDQNKKILGAVVLFSNITQQKHIQKRLEILDALIQIVEALVQYSTPEKGIHQLENTTEKIMQQIGQTILAMAQPLLGYSHALILEVQAETQNLSLLEMMGFQNKQEELLRSIFTDTHLNLLVSDPETKKRLERQELAPFDITQSPLLQKLFPVSTIPNCLLTPIYISSRLVGLLGIAFAKGDYTLNEEDRALIIAISRLCALALQYGHHAIEQERLQIARDLLNEELERVNSLQSTFISVVGHEFRTALTSIEGFSALLIDGDFSPEEAKDFATDINKDAIRLHHMITDLLDLEQMKKGKMQLRLESVDINLLLMESAKRIRLTKPEYLLNLNLEVGSPLLQGDPDKLAQVISNLLSNAVKYSPDGGEIAVSSRTENGQAHVRIQDHGMGIPPDRIEDIFTPYQRITTMSTRHIQGTGLGLGIAKQIVELHRGNIWVESVLGQGSTFHVLLPFSH